MLGVDDYGIFVVVGGIVGMLSFLNSAMASSTQRHLSFSLGTGSLDKLRSVFANSIILHIIIGFLLVIVLEIAGMYLLNNELKIAPDRLPAANLLFHFVVFSTFISVISVPYNAVLNAHENMLFLSFTDILDSLLRLLIALSLYITPYDPLLTFGLLLVANNLIIRAIKWSYCRRKYAECTVRLRREADKELMKELGSFAGWNLFGVLAAVFRNQGIAVVLNLFFGTFVVAAYGIANQVNSKLLLFTTNMMQSIRPQIMKSEGAGDRARMLRLTVLAGKFSFYIFSILFIPVYIEMPALLNLWLKEVPEGAVIFCRLIMVLTLINQLSQGIMVAVQAIGRIRTYQAVAGSLLLLTLPIGYVLLDRGYPPHYVLWAAIFIEVTTTVFRIIYFEYISGHRIRLFVTENLLMPALPFSIALGSAMLLHHIGLPPIARGILVLTVPVLLYLPLIYVLGTNRTEKKHIVEVVNAIKRRI